jgi:release factor glutamine methyltransferase
MKALDKLRKTLQALENAGIDNPGREAELIISHCLGIDRVAVYKDNPGIDEYMNSEIDEFLGRRAKREPLQYILGYTEFCGLKIKVGPGVLIPRPETELLAEEAIKKIQNLEGNARNSKPAIVDLCTGSGCLALAIAREFPGAIVYGTDLSGTAIGYAIENAGINGVRNATFLRGSLFDPIRNMLSAGPLTFDLIISNPPYIRREDIGNLQPEIREWEPGEALDGGEDGLDYYRLIVREAGSYLKESGLLMFEIGMDQGGPVKRIARDYGFPDVSLIRDYAGIERILIAGKG